MLDWLFNRGEKRSKVRSAHPSDPAIWELLGGGYGSTGGIPVNVSSALQLAVVYRCIMVISEGLAWLPIETYRRKSGDTRERDRAVAAYRLLNEAPNPEQLPSEFRQEGNAHMLSRGAGYAEIVLSRLGEPVELWPIHPDRVEVERDKQGRRVYRIEPQSRTRSNDPQRAPQQGTRTLYEHEVFRFRGSQIDGSKPMGVIDRARQVVGAALAAQDYGLRFFENDARPSIVIESKKQLSETAAERLANSIRDKFTGANRHKPLVLEDETTVKPFSITPEAAQFLETRRFTIPEICRLFGVPPHKVFELEGAKFNNIEQMQRLFAVDTLLPIARRNEQEIDAKLIRPYAGVRAYCEHDLSAQLKGDTKTRYEAHEIGLRTGILSIDEVRASENLNPLPNDAGRAHYVPLNMGKVEDVGSSDSKSKAEPEPDTEEDEDRSRGLLAGERMVLEPVIGATLERILAREGNALGRKASKIDDSAELAEEASVWAGNQLDAVRRDLAPVLLAIARCLGEAEPETFAAVHAGNFARRYADDVEHDYRDDWIRRAGGGAAGLKAIIEQRKRDKPAQWVNDLLHEHGDAS